MRVILLFWPTSWNNRDLRWNDAEDTVTARTRSCASMDSKVVRHAVPSLRVIMGDEREILARLTDATAGFFQSL